MRQSEVTVVAHVLAIDYHSTPSPSHSIQSDSDSIRALLVDYYFIPYPLVRVST